MSSESLVTGTTVFLAAAFETAFLPGLGASPSSSASEEATTFDLSVREDAKVDADAVCDNFGGGR
jgi:hypothetical protein